MILRSFFFVVVVVGVVAVVVDFNAIAVFV
jgi:hypothetical protein